MFQSLCVSLKNLFDTCVHKHMKLNRVLVEKPSVFFSISNKDLCLDTKGNLIKMQIQIHLYVFVEL